MNGSLEVYAEHRGRLFGLAYRMLGSVVEAEDVVQDAFVRWSAADRDDVRSAGAFLTAVTTRLAIDRLRSAQHRRETYVGPWLPEPLLVSDADPAAAAELSDSLTTAFLVLLERLNPLERAVLLLHEVFGYGYDEVAEVVQRPASTCRQIASRARARLAPDRRPRYEADPAEEARLVGAFAAASFGGDVDALVKVLAEDVALWTDGGPSRHAARRPVLGPARVARFVANLAHRLPPDVAFAPARLNGDLGLVMTTPEGPYMTLAFELGPTGIRAIHVVMNPDKLRHLADAATQDGPPVDRTTP